MTETDDRVVIVGAGQAGGWLAATIRELQPARPITLIGAETHPPYERPPLSKDILLGKAEPESAYLKPLSYYADNHIELILGTSVTRIDRAARQLELEDGRTIGYGTLALATGLRPRPLTVPGADHHRIRYLRTLSDLAPIRERLSPDARVVVIGAGFIGLEVAAAARVSGCRVTVVEAAPCALGRVMAPEVSEAIVQRHKDRGVEFLFGAQVEEIVDREGEAVVRHSSGGELPADLVLCGIGSIANDEIASDAGLGCAGGIVVDAAGRTSDPHIFAAGDIAVQATAALGRSLRLESWQNAQNQAIAVGRHIAGMSASHDDVPWFWTDQYDFNFQMIGLTDRWDRIVWRGTPDDEKFTAIYLADGRIVAANAMNNARDIRPLKELIRERRPVDADLIADTGLSLVKLQKMQAVT